MSRISHFPLRPGPEGRAFGLAEFLRVGSVLLSICSALLSVEARATTLERRIASSADDAEESATAAVALNSNDLELVRDANNQTVGMRWTGLAIPNGATITAAYIQFGAKDAQSEVTSLSFRGQATDNAPTFSSANGNISTRPRTAAATNWTPPAWTKNQTGPNQRTPDLSAAIQEIVSRPGWARGNALAIIVTGSGRRIAFSFDGRAGASPLLHVEYLNHAPTLAPPSNMTVDEGATADQALSATDSDGDPLTFSLVSGPAYAAVTTITPGTGTATGNLHLAPGFFNAGTATATVRASDGAVNSDGSLTIIVNNVNQAPVLGQPANMTVYAGTTADQALSATDADAQPLTFSLVSGPAYATVTTITPGTGAATGNLHVGPGSSVVETATAMVRASDGTANSDRSLTITVNPPPPEFPPAASLSVTLLSSPPLTVTANASGSTDIDLTPIASFQFDFGDGTPVVATTVPTASAQHTYASEGTYTVTLVVTDTGGNASTPATRTVTVSASPATTVEGRTAAASDDAEENATRSVDLNSSDLELIHDSSDQTVGMRWTGLGILKGATITAAYIQLSAKESQSEVTNLTFRGQAADNAATFSTITGDISNRPRTAAAMNWAPVAWTAGEAGPNQRTPDMSAVIQEVVSRPGWASGNALAVIVTGTGHRTAWAWNGNAAASPLLHVEYVGGDRPPTASLSVTQLASPPKTVTVDGSGSTDTDATPIASYRFDFGDGTAPVTTTAPSAQHTYAYGGIYTVTLVVTDTGGNASAPAIRSITVSGPEQIAVYVGYYDTHHSSHPQPKPDPWRTSANVVFVGLPDGQAGDPPGGAWDSSVLRIDNLTGGSLSGVVVTADMGTSHFALWGTKTIPAGSSLILAQTGIENFDGSDTNPAGCYGCDTTLCHTRVVSTVPVVHVTIGGVTTHYYDTGQILNTHGADFAGCPVPAGPFPQTRNDESAPWQRIFQSTTPPTAAPWGLALPRVDSPDAGLWLAPPAPNPARGELTVRYSTPTHGMVRIGVYDVAGRLVRMCVDGVEDAGTYAFQVDLGSVATGVYFLHMTTPQGIQHKKILLVR
jgi:PKD repeat protein